MGYYDGGEWNVDEGGEKYWKIGGDEVDDEDLLRESRVVGGLGFVVFKVVKAGGEAVHNIYEDGQDGGEDASGKENLAKSAYAFKCLLGEYTPESTSAAHCKSPI